MGQALLTLWASSVLVWSLLLLAPGDPARRVLAAKNIVNPNPLQVSAERTKLGLRGSPVHRYLRWLGGAVHGDLGTSWVTGHTVVHELGSRLPATLRLAIASFGISVVLALLLALIAASAPRRWPDTLARVVSLAFLVTPSFLLGTLLLDLVVVRWGHFRVLTTGHWDTVLLPAVTLSLGSAVVWSRILRGCLLESAGADYLEVSAARGAGRIRLLLVHALPNSAVPFLTVMAVGVAGLLGGAPIVETVFNWPGIGAFAVQSVTARDIPVIQGFTLFAVLAFVLTSLLIDVAVGALDPRARRAAAAGSGHG